jgi:DNA-binding Xre family transcriptional regulator
LLSQGQMRYTSISVILQGSEEDIRVNEPSPPIVRPGTVVSRLAALQAQAAELWGIRLTHRWMAEVTLIPLKMIQALCKLPSRQNIKRLDLFALGKLCWLFDCESDQLLAYLPPGASVASLPPVQMRRTEQPLQGEVPPQVQIVHMRLPAILAKEKVGSIMHSTGKKHDTIAAIRSGKPRRIMQATLVAICNAAYRKDPTSGHIREILALDRASLDKA